MALPDTFKPVFAVEAAITITLDNLANLAVAIANAIDNSGNLYEEILLEIKISGTAATNAFLEVRIAESIDGGTDYSTWESGTVLPSIDLSVNPQIYHVRFLAPQRFKLMVKNRTGNALASSGNTASYQGINSQVVD